MTTTTILPAGPQQDHFDSHAFDGRRGRAVSVQPAGPERSRIVEDPSHTDFRSLGLSFHDYSGCHQKARLGSHMRGPAPEWALNDLLARTVVLRYLEGRMYLPFGDDLSVSERMARINAAIELRTKISEKTLDRLLDRQSTVATREVQNVDSRIMVERHGVASVVCAVIYFKYRLGWNSSEISKQLKFLMKPPAIRILLWRLNSVAKKWEAGTVRRKNYTVNWMKPKAPRRSRRLTAPHSDVELIWKMRNRRGMGWRAIAKELGTHTASVRSQYLRWFPTVLKTRQHPVKFKWGEQEMDKIRLLRKFGLSWSQIGTFYKVNASTLYSAVQRHAPDLCHLERRKQKDRNISRKSRSK
jgi:hypothetical protein